MKKINENVLGIKSLESLTRLKELAGIKESEDTFEFGKKIKHEFEDNDREVKILVKTVREDNENNVHIIVNIDGESQKLCLKPMMVSELIKTLIKFEK